VHELRDELAAVQGVQHELAARCLDALTGNSRRDRPILGVDSLRGPVGLVLRQVAISSKQNPSRYWSPGRVLLVLLTAVALFALFLRPGQMAPARMVNIPGGDYALAATATESVDPIVTLKPFAIDRSEVTNANYRQCVAVGECLAPRSPASGAKPDYFVDPAYEDYPVVNVTWPAAEQFCRWLGKRLPTAAEWEIAAGYSPILERSLRYPWGDLYQPQLANIVDSGLGEPRPVGSYQPNGDSPSGLFDMAGNVAEWTATAAEDGGDRKIVKGGSYQDSADEVHVRAEQRLSPADGLPWLGFRCAADLPESDWTS
jgi:formylglycine-generating enzyme required for sulfatase activity